MYKCHISGEQIHTCNNLNIYIHPYVLLKQVILLTVPSSISSKQSEEHHFPFFEVSEMKEFFYINNTQ